MLLQYHTEWLYRFGRLIFTIHPKAGSGITPCGGCRGKEVATAWYDRCAQACGNCEVKAYIAEPLRVPSAPQLCAYFGSTDPSWHRRRIDFELNIMSEEKSLTIFGLPKSHMPDGTKPPSREDFEPEPEATIDVLTKSALETPIPTTPTMKSKLATNESLGDRLELTATDSEDCEDEVTPAVRDRQPTRRYSPRVSAIKRDSISSDSKRYALEYTVSSTNSTPEHSSEEEAEDVEELLVQSAAGADPLQHMVDSDMTFLPSGSESDGEDDLDESPSEEESGDGTQTRITSFLPPAKKTTSTPERAELAKLCDPEGSPIYSVTGTSQTNAVPSFVKGVNRTPLGKVETTTEEVAECLVVHPDYRHRYVDAWGTKQLLDFLEQECGQSKLARGLSEMKSTLKGQQASRLHENTWARCMMGLQIVGINYDTKEAETAAKDIVTRLHTFRTGEAFSPFCRDA